MKKRYDIDEFYNNAIKDLTKNEDKAVYPAFFYQSFYNGKNTYYQKEQIESRRFDDLWIKTIESYFPSINRITLNLKSSLKYQSEIIPIEKTKKINKESVMHLMSHSNFVKEITDEGVVPKQILSFLPEVEYGIYENRFIMTLINRLRDFLNRRVKLMKEKLKASRTTQLIINSQMNFEESDFEMSIDIKQTQQVERRKVDEHNELVLERAEKLYKLITRLYNSQFMRTLRKFKPVSSPIIKTQIILKNPDFKNAYLLWMYLDRYNELGYQLDIDSTNKQFTEQYTKNINQSLLMILTTLLANDKSGTTDRSLAKKPVYKIKNAKTINKLPSEIEIEPIAFELEDTGINEYYLEKNKQILKKQYENLIDEGNNYKIALKKALADTLNITNALYESFFEINADEDIFHQLIREDDPQKMYDEAYKKFIIACSVREVKENDFRKTIALEKQWQKELKKYHKLMIEGEAAAENKKCTDILEELSKKYKENLDICIARDYREKQGLMRKQRLETEVLLKKLKQEYSDKKKQIVEETKKKLAEERKQITEKAKAARLREESQHKETMQKLKEKHAEKMQQLVEQYKDKYEKQAEALINKAHESIKKQKERIDKQAENRKIKAQQAIARQKESSKLRQKVREESLRKSNSDKLSKLKEKLNEDKQKKVAEYQKAKETDVAKKE